MDTRATGEPGDAAAAAPQDQPLQSAMKWWPGAPACRSRRAASGESSRQRRQQGSPLVFAAHGQWNFPALLQRIVGGPGLLGN
jgi:hypothetical protein